MQGGDMHRAKQKGQGRDRRRGRELSVGVVCAHSSEREALVLALGAADGIRAIECGPGTADSVTLARDLMIDLVLIALEPGPAASFATALRSAAPTIRAVALVHSNSEAAPARLVAAGIVGFVPSGAGLVACIRTLRAVRSRGFLYPPKIAAEVMAAPSGRGEPIGLRGRPLQVAECLAEGCTNKEIAAQLRIAEGTVKSHVHAVLIALGVEHRWEVRAVLATHLPRLHLVRKSKREAGE